jgi:hypothetical protein
MAGEVFENEQASVEQTVAAIRVVMSWQKYWWSFHPKPRVQEQVIDAWLKNTELMENYERMQGNGVVS